MIYEISNKLLKVKIDSVGAEIISVKSKKNDCEFIWQGDEKYWMGHSPILFPFCGRLFGKKYTYKGKEYEMMKHGFVRHDEFKLLEKNEDSIKFAYLDNKKTRDIYPFKFEFIVGYSLNEETLEFTFEVINKDDKDVLFSFGGHPAFNVPINGIGKFEDYYLEFTRNNYMQRTFSPSALYSGKDEPFILKDNKLELRHNLFDNDAIFLEDKKDVITLKSNLNNNYVQMRFDNMTCVGFWHLDHSDAPYVCMEPACGFPGLEGKLEDLKTKFEVNKVKVNERYLNSYSVTFHVE